jgi:UDP-glucose 4-epimerase
MMDSVLITGGGGFLGRHLASCCAKAGLAVTVLDDLSCPNSTLRCEELDTRGIECVEGSIFDKALISSLLKHNRSIVHFASVVGVGQTIEHPIETATNLVGTLHLARCLTADHSVVFGSSADIYGMHSKLYSKPMREEDDVVYEHPPVNRWVYPMVKAIEESVLAAAPARCVAVRIFNSFGPGMDYPHAKRVVPQFLNAILRGEPIRIHGSGEQQRSFCYYTDTIKGVWRALQYANTLSPGQHVAINIGSDQPISIRELADRMNHLAIEEGLIEKPMEVHVDQSGFYVETFNDLWDRTPDLTRARDLLGFEPQVSLNAGIQAIMHWAKNLPRFSHTSEPSHSWPRRTPTPDDARANR